MRQYRHILEIVPNDAEAANNLAWILATDQDSTLDAIGEALRLARFVVARDGGWQPTTLDTLAAAFAASGDTDQAALIARRALRLARLRHDTDLAEKIETRLRRYAAGLE